MCIAPTPKNIFAGIKIRKFSEITFKHLSDKEFVRLTFDNVKFDIFNSPTNVIFTYGMIFCVYLMFVSNGANLNIGTLWFHTLRVLEPLNTRQTLSGMSTLAYFAIASVMKKNSFFL